MKLQIVFGQDYIGIYSGKKEIVYWHIDEWKEDPNVVFSICNAVILSVKNPTEFVKLLKKAHKSIQLKTEAKCNI